MECPEEKSDTPFNTWLYFCTGVVCTIFECIECWWCGCFLRELSVPAPIPEDQILRLRFMVEGVVEDVEFTTDLVTTR